MQMGEEDPDFERVIHEYNRLVQFDPDVETLNETVLEHMETVHRLDREMTIKVKWSVLLLIKCWDRNSAWKGSQVTDYPQPLKG